LIDWLVFIFYIESYTKDGKEKKIQTSHRNKHRLTQ